MLIQGAVMVMWLIWLTIYWRGGLDILQDLLNAQSGRDRLLLLILSACTMGIIIIMVQQVFYSDETAHDLAIVGAGFVLIGIGGTFYCRHLLGRFWTAENALQTEHSIIRAGAYGYVRHPIYSFAIMLYLGTGVTFMDRWMLALVAVVVVGYVIKAFEEDRFLALHLAGYEAYQVDVPYRLMPRVW